MLVMKRNGAEVPFDRGKIEKAITNAAQGRIGDTGLLTDKVEAECRKLSRTVAVEEIQDMVEEALMAAGEYKVARDYVRYRYDREKLRKKNTTDDRILTLIECNNEEALQENSNKDPVINSVQRDYMAGEVSRDLTRRVLLPEDIVKADAEGIIHFHKQNCGFAA